MTGFAISGIGVALRPYRTDARERELRREAVELAVADAGLTLPDVDGYIAAMGPVGDVRFLGLAPGFVVAVDSGGSSPATALVTAIGAIRSGLARHVLCSFASVVGETSGSIGEVSHRYPSLWGMSGAVTAHALLARRYLDTYGRSERDLAAVAVSQRSCAAVRPDALHHGRPLRTEDHLDSPYISEPLRRLDCCRDANVGAALVVSRLDDARGSAPRPVEIAGLGTGDNIRSWHAGTVFDRHDDVEPGFSAALRAAGITRADIDVVQLYDPFTISVLMQLEHFGFCGPGEAGDLVAAGETAPTGRIPTNTGGGQLSGWYAIGFTPIVEAVRQLRGDGGATQVRGATTALVSNHGGTSGVPNTYHHTSLILRTVA